MSGSRIYKCGVIVFIGLVLMSIGVVAIFTRVKASARQKVAETYVASKKSDAKMLASHLGPNARKQMQQIKEKFGPVESFQIRTVRAKISGQWEAEIEARREKARTVESVGNTSGIGRITYFRAKAAL